MKEKERTSRRIGRRRFLQIVAATGTAATLWHLGLKDKILTGQVARQSRTLMGTQINLIVYGPDRATSEEAIHATFTRMDHIISKLSRHDADSELSILNRNGYLENPGKDIHTVLRLARDLSNSTRGAFDVTVLPLQELYRQSSILNSLPSENALLTALELTDYRKIDLGKNRIQFQRQGMGITLDGIGKGYIVDQGIATLKTKGFDNVYVEAGGDLMVTGTKAAGKPWRIGVRNPRPETADELIVMGMSNRAVATSGDYMQPFTADLRHHHIIDPRTGTSPPELASATVTAPSVVLADGLATAAMVLGPRQSLDLMETLTDCECLLIGKDLSQYRSSGLNS